jgi:hypothetical protein
MYYKWYINYVGENKRFCFINFEAPHYVGLISSILLLLPLFAHADSSHHFLLFGSAK